MEQGHFYRLRIRGRRHDVPKAKYFGRFRFDWVPEYRGAEPSETLEREWFTYVAGGDVIMLSIPPDDILGYEAVT